MRLSAISTAFLTLSGTVTAVFTADDVVENINILISKSRTLIVSANSLALCLMPFVTWLGRVFGWSVPLFLLMFLPSTGSNTKKGVCTSRVSCPFGVDKGGSYTAFSEKKRAIKPAVDRWDEDIFFDLRFRNSPILSSLS